MAVRDPSYATVLRLQSVFFFFSKILLGLNGSNIQTKPQLARYHLDTFSSRELLQLRGEGGGISTGINKKRYQTKQNKTKK